MRVLTVFAAIVCLVASAPPAIGQEGDVSELVEQIFEGRPDDNFVSVVVHDEARGMYLGFYRATYLDLQELRAYAVPYRSADQDAINAALNEGDHATAFNSLLEDMRVSLGAKYVSDVNLDGIRDEKVPLGQGSMQDNFHKGLFASHAEADEAYRGWLRRAAELRQREG